MRRFIEVISEFVSRGIQIYTQGGEYGTVDGVTIESNRIRTNGHADYEDGVAVNGTDTGTIRNVTIRHNLIYDNYFSGLRFVGNALADIRVEYNTFYQNGSGSSSDISKSPMEADARAVSRHAVQIIVRSKSRKPLRPAFPNNIAQDSRHVSCFNHRTRSYASASLA